MSGRAGRLQPAGAGRMAHAAEPRMAPEEEQRVRDVPRVAERPDARMAPGAPEGAQAAPYVRAAASMAP